MPFHPCSCERNLFQIVSCLLILFPTIDPLPPPSDVNISHITENSDGSMDLMFTWTPVVLNCPNIHYVIASDCGFCPNTTTATTVNCSGIMLSERCSFAVRSVVCDSITGSTSTIFVDLKGIYSPVRKL